jgi:hypothetical protein
MSFRKIFVFLSVVGAFVVVCQGKMVGDEPKTVYLNTIDCVNPDSREENGDSCDNHILLSGNARSCPTQCNSLDECVNSSNEVILTDLTVLMSGAVTSVDDFSPPKIGTYGVQPVIQTVFPCFMTYKCRCITKNNNTVCVTIEDQATIHNLIKYRIPENPVICAPLID